jgi:hypothetical protein
LRKTKIFEGVNALPSGSQQVYPKEDVNYIRAALHSLLSPETQTASAHIIMLGPSWRADPWSEVEDAKRPEKWELPVLLAVPEAVESGGETMRAVLGTWLKENLSRRRNTVRFLLTKKASFQTRNLFF